MDFLPGARNSITLELHLNGPPGDPGGQRLLMSVYKRKGTDKWLLDVAAADGKRIRQSSGTKVYAEAKAAERRLLATIENGEPLPLPAAAVTVDEMVRQFREHQNKLYPRSKDYFRVLSGHFADGFKQRTLKGITRQDLDRLHGDALQRWKPGTVNLLFQVIKRIFNLAIEWGYLEKSPAAGIKRKTVTVRDRRMLTYDQKVQLLDGCTLNFRLLIWVALRTGLREMELIKLRPSRINFRNSFLLVTDTKSGKDRQVPMLPDVKTLLLVLADFEGDTPFFKSKLGKPYTAAGVISNFSRLRDRLGMPKVCFHDLRHTFASDCLAAGMKESVIQQLLGHASIETTQIYAKLTAKYIQGKMPVLGEYLAAQSAAQFLGREDGRDGQNDAKSLYS